MVRRSGSAYDIGLAPREAQRVAFRPPISGRDDRDDHDGHGGRNLRCRYLHRDQRATSVGTGAGTRAGIALPNADIERRLATWIDDNSVVGW